MALVLFELPDVFILVLFVKSVVAFVVLLAQISHLVFPGVLLGTCEVPYRQFSVLISVCCFEIVSVIHIVFLV